MRGTGFEPDREMLAHSVHCAFLVGFKSVLLFAHCVRSCAGPDLNREDFASLVLWAANPLRPLSVLTIVRTEYARDRI
mgnify:CR=1 FL=1